MSYYLGTTTGITNCFADGSQLFEQISDAKGNELPWRKYAYYMKYEMRGYVLFYV